MDRFDSAFDRFDDIYDVHDVQFGLAVSSMPIVPARIRAPIMGEAAAPDLPARVGWMILAAYGAILAAFLALYTGSGRAAFMVAISATYMAVFFAVPFAFLRNEPQHGPRPSYARFLQQGIDTWTGHLTGREAVIQILTIPVMIAVAITGIGIIAALTL